MALQSGEIHAFEPSRPGGMVCVAWRDLGVLNGVVRTNEQCGYPAGHAIHAVAAEHDPHGLLAAAGIGEPARVRRPGRGYQGKIEALTARAAAALTLLGFLKADVIAEIIPDHDNRSRFRENICKVEDALALPATTPAEQRTGVSDRTAAALADVAEMRRKMMGMQGGTLMLAALDRIEQALRGEQ